MKRIAAPLAVVGGLFLIYLWTLAPGTFWLDSPAFAACNEILGLPHSPSFPLYTLLGRVMHLLLPLNPTVASNIYSALMMAAAALLFYFILQAVIGFLIGVQKTSLVAACGTLVAFLAIPVWQSAIRAEVYALQLLLGLLVVFAFIKSLAASGKRSVTWFIFAVFVQGLSMANHPLLALATLPLILILPFKTIGLNPRRLFLPVLASALVLIVGLSLYTYLPIRAAEEPAINSGRHDSIAQTIKTITRTGDKDFLPATTVAVIANYPERLARMARFAFDQTGGLVFLGFLTAVIIGIRRKVYPFLFLGLPIFLGGTIVVWAADFQPSNLDIIAYLGLPIVLMILLSFAGLAFLIDRYRHIRLTSRFAPVILVLIAFFQLYGNLYACDLSLSRGADFLAESILTRAPQRAILIVNEDDVLLPLWYYSYAEKKRPDLAIFSAGALYRPDYRRHLMRQHPDLLYPELFREGRFENLDQVINEFCLANIPARPIQIQFGVPGVETTQLCPDGFLFRYKCTDKDNRENRETDQIVLLDSIIGHSADAVTRQFVARNAFNFGVYHDRAGNGRAAFRLFEYALDADPGNPEYPLRLGMAMIKAGRIDEGRAFLREAVMVEDGCPEAEELLRRLDRRERNQS